MPNSAFPRIVRRCQVFSILSEITLWIRAVYAEECHLVRSLVRLPYRKCHLGKQHYHCKMFAMTTPRDPHEIELGLLFPSLPEDRREEMRDFLDGYCEIAFQVFERLERERWSRIDRSHETS